MFNSCVNGELVFNFCFVLTLVTLVSDAIMLSSLVRQEFVFVFCLVPTLITLVSDTLVLSSRVIEERALMLCFILAQVTLVSDTLVITSDMPLQSRFLFRLERTFITSVDNAFTFSSVVTNEFVFNFCFVLAQVALESDTLVLTANMTFKIYFPVSLK
jgi:hypothetical protein